MLLYNIEEEVMAKAVSDDYPAGAIPKAELHCHLAGTLCAPRTVAGGSPSAPGLELPRAGRQAPTNGRIFYGLSLDVASADRPWYWRTARPILPAPSTNKRPEDGRPRRQSFGHVEFFFNPDYFYPNGIDYPAMVDGMIEGNPRRREEISACRAC